MSDRFYTTDFLATGEYILSGSEAHHLSGVRRFAPGDSVTLFNGDGHEYSAIILESGKKSATLNVLRADLIDRELLFPIVVASAVPKGDRADFLIEKLTELGVTRFVPLITTRSVVQPKDSTVEKFKRAVIESSKQCGRNRLMSVDPPRNWNAFLKLPDLPETRIVLHTGEGSSGLTEQSGCVVAVGPEGGFTPDEVDAALAVGWRARSLGSRVLRVETAAIAAAALLGSTAIEERNRK